MRAPPSRRSLLNAAGLVLASLAFAAMLELAHVPAAFLLGPMLAAVAFALRDRATELPRWSFLIGQSIVGMMMAGNLPLTLFAELRQDWPIFALGTGFTLFAAFGFGWLIARSGLLPGNTAIWGASPGAASAITVMSADYGADMPLVALMQYLRVICCAIAAAGVARLAGVPPGTELPVAEPVAWLPALPAIALALASALVAGRIRVPGGSFLLPIALGMAVKATGLFPIDLPAPVLALGYALVGWGIGARFTPEVVRHAARVFPRVLASTLALLALCAGFGGLLTLFADIDPLTAYLATSPGGADSVSIIAAAVPVDVPFVVAMQMARMLCVLLLGPWLAQRLSRRIPAPT